MRMANSVALFDFTRRSFSLSFLNGPADRLSNLTLHAWCAMGEAMEQRTNSGMPHARAHQRWPS
jgi:hypothetical protein